MKNSWFSFLSLCREIFPSALIFYLLLFLLEILFPGFISYNMNRYWLLGIVSLLGVFSTLFPADRIISPRFTPNKLDYGLIIFFSVLAAALIFRETSAPPLAHWLITIISGLLTTGLGLLILYIDRLNNIPNPLISITQTRFFHKTELPVLPLLFFFVIIAILFPSRLETISTPPKTLVTIPTTAQTTNLPTPATIKLNPNLSIKILNASDQNGIAQEFADTLIAAGFRKVEVGNAGSDLKLNNATIQFSEDQEDQAVLIQKLLEIDYTIVTGFPAASKSGELTVILGTKTL